MPSLPPIEGESSAKEGHSKPRKVFQKKDLIEAVRKLQPSTTQSQSQVLLAKAVQGKSGAKAGPPSGSVKSSRQVQVMEAGVNLNVKKFNELKILGDRKSTELKEKMDTLASLKMENDALVKMQKKQTPESQRIQELLANIQTANDTTDRKLHYRRQLEHMLRRLGKNQITFDAHINGMEDALKGSRREQDEITVLTRQLEAGKTKAIHDLHLMQRQVSLERRDRTRTLTMRQTEAHNARRMEKWRKDREEMRTEFAADMMGDMSREEERALKEKLSDRMAAADALREENEKRQKVAAELEDRFMRIRQATGVNSLSEMVDKFVGQDSNRASLEVEKKEAEARLETAKAAKEAAEKRFGSLKASGIGSSEVNRDAAEQLTSEIAEAQADHKVNKATCERLQGVLVSLRQGATGLYQRLKAHAHLLEGELAAPEAADSSAAMDPLEAVHLSEIILSKMIESVGSGANAGASAADASSPSRSQQLATVGPSAAAGHGDDDGEGGAGQLALVDLMEPTNAPGNVRVRSTVQDRALEAKQQQAEHAAEAAEAANEDQGSMLDDLDIVDEMVPSRAFLKLSSGRQHSEMLRKREQEKRRKKMAELMAGADDGENAAAKAGAARKRAQEAAAYRLSSQPSPPGFPPGLTLKDGAMERSKAFLTQMPTLT